MTTQSSIGQAHLQYAVAQLKPGVFLIPCLTPVPAVKEEAELIQGEDTDSACNAAAKIRLLS